ncbi:MAG TPA: hypothetical protein VMD47_10400 [Candidatus Acidoferrales bacterium]|nr:hypothetical protein [Candidatus Acidoferrales bacterium]
MRFERIAIVALLYGAALCGAVSVRAQSTPAPGVTPTPFAQPLLSPSPSESPEASESPAPSGSPQSPTPTPTLTPTPTPPPITVSPNVAYIPVGSTQTLTVNGSLGNLTVTPATSTFYTMTIDQDARTITLTGTAPGAGTITITDTRGVSASVGVRVAYQAGALPQPFTVRVTGDPAGRDFLQNLVVRQILKFTMLRPGAQAIVAPGDVGLTSDLAQDTTVTVDVPVLLQGLNYFAVNGTVPVTLQNVAVPRISPDILMVSDFPEKLTENGILFEADLKREVPSRFLYYHYNPPGQPDRRIVLVAQNESVEPATVQYISGRGSAKYEMEAGHAATKDFLVDVVQNQGRLLQIPGNATEVIATQEMPAGQIVTNLLQLRVLEGSTVHLTLVAQDASDDPETALTTGKLLTSTVRHARGIYTIPEFHFATEWNVNDPYLDMPIGQIPLPNSMRGEALSGDYGVLESFVVNVQNPLPTPQAIAIYEEPRGGSATGTYLIDGTLVQSHQVKAFTRYKIREYVVPAKGFVRVTIVTMPEAGSSLPLNLIFAPDDGSVAPGGPGSPIY